MAQKDQREKTILMAHGGGGELMNRLLEGHIFSKLSNSYLDGHGDSAVIDFGSERICFTTDGFVVRPLFFPGGDIGMLSVCGTVNDLSVMGAEPKAISLGMIIEEGLEVSSFDRIVDSIRTAAESAGVDIVTGDTKVIEGGRGDGIMITTAGIGRLRKDADISISRIQEGDVIIVTGNIAEHGLAVMSAREGFEFETSIKSDAACLNSLTGAIFEAGCDVKFMRDPTRGGFANVVCDICEHSNLSVEVFEKQIPIERGVVHLSEVLGLDPLSVANEGKIVIVAEKDHGRKIVDICRSHELGHAAAIVGTVTSGEPAVSQLVTRSGGRRIIQRPYGEQLPRIC